ncbi:HTH_Tnp_Tc3_2 domain-containing protein [Trichonephila clavipes]|nr:HTH_Tnp_Tc3_2 domain-containing protein [Trichonephila clavipes]
MGHCQHSADSGCPLNAEGFGLFWHDWIRAAFIHCLHSRACLQQVKETHILHDLDSFCLLPEIPKPSVHCSGVTATACHRCNGRISPQNLQRRPRQTSRREDSHIIRNARVQPTASSAAIQAHVAPSLGAPVSSRTMGRHLAEGHLGPWHSLRVLPLTPTQLTPPFGVVPRTRKLDCSRMEPGRL